MNKLFLIFLTSFSSLLMFNKKDYLPKNNTASKKYESYEYTMPNNIIIKSFTYSIDNIEITKDDGMAYLDIPIYSKSSDTYGVILDLSIENEKGDVYNKSTNEDFYIKINKLSNTKTATASFSFKKSILNGTNIFKLNVFSMYDLKSETIEFKYTYPYNYKFQKSEVKIYTKFLYAGVLSKLFYDYIYFQNVDIQNYYPYTLMLPLKSFKLNYRLSDEINSDAYFTLEIEDNKRILRKMYKPSNSNEKTYFFLDLSYEKNESYITFKLKNTYYRNPKTNRVFMLKNGIYYISENTIFYPKDDIAYFNEITYRIIGENFSSSINDFVFEFKIYQDSRYIEDLIDFSVENNKKIDINEKETVSI